MRSSVTFIFIFLSFKKQFDLAMEFLRTEMGMGQSETSKAQALITDLSYEEKAIYTKRFQSIDQEKKGFISMSDIRRSLRVCMGTLQNIWDKRWDKSI